MFLQGPPTLLQDPKPPQERGLSNAKLHFVGVLGTVIMMESYDVSFGIFPH